MIRVVVGALADQEAEAVMRPVQTDFAPVSAASRDLEASAGPAVTERLERLESLPVGGAVMTPAGDLGCAFLIHVVVTSADEPQTSQTVQRAVGNGLRRASDMGIESVALPPLGIGVGMTEPEAAARSLCEILQAHLHEGVPPLDLTIVVTASWESEMFEGILRDLGLRPEDDSAA